MNDPVVQFTPGLFLINRGDSANHPRGRLRYAALAGLTINVPEAAFAAHRREHEAARDRAAPASPIKTFVEKPVLSTANTYLESGDFFWNSGMFMFNSEGYVNALEEHAPEILSACRTSVEKSTFDTVNMLIGDVVRGAATTVSMLTTAFRSNA